MNSPLYKPERSFPLRLPIHPVHQPICPQLPPDHWISICVLFTPCLQSGACEKYISLAYAPGTTVVLLDLISGYLVAGLVTIRKLCAQHSIFLCHALHSGPTLARPAYCGGGTTPRPPSPWTSVHFPRFFIDLVLRNVAFLSKLTEV